MDRSVNFQEGARINKNRPYYGINEIKNGSCIYGAAVAEMCEGAPDRYECETYVLENGEYIAVLIGDWRKKTESIKDVFQEMMQTTG